MMPNNKRSNVNTGQEKTLSRRKFMQMAGGGMALLTIPGANIFAREATRVTGDAKQAGRPKIVWVMLRGGLDSMHTIVPEFDPQYRKLRPNLSASFHSPLLPLARGFSLHPSLSTMHKWYQQKSLLPVVAVSSGYQERSHFDAQDFLESGLGNIDHDSGWLARAIAVNNQSALAVSRTVPISLRSAANVDTWFPSNLKDGDQSLYSALQDLYQYHPRMNESLQSGLKVKGLVDDDIVTRRQGNFMQLCKSAGQIMVADKGPDCVMLELGGWDTHNSQGNRLDRQLKQLDDGLATLQSSLGQQWQQTVVMIATEFGRTAKENGTAGTDHGTASGMFIAGGAVKGGRVLGSWPGLKTEQLLAGRDLMPTSNMFGWIGNVLAEHWQLSEQQIAQIFPHMKPYRESLIQKPA
ncbi:DUF1501 domain-containing protein [Thalassotalea litorea]|uniref:DUF1501 domain-containing protein n=1 Tax=Thalassotalea litorea TaxID=2020715 RepID=UPI0037363747